jgi:DNA-binding PadR family transcriptional regulator
LVEKPDKKRSAYRITEKGKGYLAKPPQEPSAKLDKSAAKSAAESAGKSAYFLSMKKTIKNCRHLMSKHNRS